MRQLKRRKVVKEFLEGRIAKNQSRIQRIAEENFKLRQQLEALNALAANKPLTKADLKAQAEATEPVMDSADQEIGMSAPAEETNAVS